MDIFWLFFLHGQRRDEIDGKDDSKRQRSYKRNKSLEEVRRK